MKRLLTILHLLIIGSSALTGSETILPGRLDAVHFEHLAIEHGLSQNNVTAIVQDHHGFLWIATLDGLNRYDGYSFHILRNHPGDTGGNSLPSNVISALLADGKRFLWIGTMTRGLGLLDISDNTLRIFTHTPDDPESLPSNRIRVLHQDHSGRIWVGTRGGGLALYHPETGTFQRISLFPDQSATNKPVHIRSLLATPEGILWVGTASQGLFVLHHLATDTAGKLTYRSRHIAPRSGSDLAPSHRRIEALMRDNSGQVWVGTYGGGIDLYRTEPESQSSELGIIKVGHFSHDPESPTSLSSNTIEVILQDHTGELWIGTADAGICRLERSTGKFIRYRHDPGNPNSLSFDNVDAFFEDRSHNLWIGTWGGGLNKLDRKPKKFFHIKRSIHGSPGLSHNYIRAIAADAQGNIWIGSSGGGLDRIKKSSGEIRNISSLLESAHSLSNNDVRSILFDRSGNLWVGTYGGGLNFASRAVLNKPEAVNSVLRFHHFRHDRQDPKSLGNDHVWALLQSRDGRIWIGTSRGVSIFDPETKTFERFVHHPGDSTSLSNNIVRTIFEAPDGTIWIGTYSGLNRYIPAAKKFRRYKHIESNANSLSHNSVTSIIAAPDSGLWLGTMGGGLNFFDPEQGLFLRFHSGHGLPNMFIHALQFDNSGRLWISSNNGLTVFDSRLQGQERMRSYDVSDGLQSNEFNAGASLKTGEGVLFFGGVNGVTAFLPEALKENRFIPEVVLTDFKVFNKSRSFARAMPELDRITLRHDDNFFAFEFAALDFTAPTKNRYAYKMEGFDSEWIEAGFRRYAGYTNLSPGDYTFRVRASNNDGVWNTRGLEIAIRVVPPFWQEWWFYSLAALLAGGIVFSLVSLRMRRLRQEKEAQEAFARKLIEAQEQERRRLAGELHDSLGQELIIINNLVQQNMHKVENSPEQARVFAGLSREIVQAINEVRRLSSELHPHLLERFGLVKAIEAMVAKITASSGLRVTLDIDGLDAALPTEARLDLYRVVQEALNNIIKHSGASEVRITAEGSEKTLHLCIEDNGCGFDSTRLQRGSGFGLTSIRQRMKTLRGEIRLRSTPGRGTTIELIIPADARRGA